MNATRHSGWCSVAAATLLLVLAPPAWAAELASPPDREPATEEGEEARLQVKYFDNWIGERVDAQRYRAMWNAAHSLRAEPVPVGPDVVNQWELVGPLYSTNPGGGRMTGRVRDVDARNHRVLAASGGLWRFNFGAVPMSDGVPAAWFGAFATHPSDPNTIILGTGEYGFGNGTGLYKTTDGGATWYYKYLSPQPTGFCRIRYSEDGAVIHASSTTGYFRSTDGGDTWLRKLNGTVTDVSTVSGDPNLVYAPVANLGLWRSTDGGLTWSQFTSGGIPTSATGNGSVSAIRPLPGGPVFIYVCFDTRVYRSFDSGVTWTDISPTGVGNSGYGPVISVCPTDPYLVLMGNVGYYRSIDGGDNWTPIVTSHLHADYHVFAWDNNGIGVWAGNDGGWSHSTDRGLTWDTTDNVMPISQFYTIDGERTYAGYLIGGTQDNNVLYTPNQALFWIDPAAGSSEGDAKGIAIDQYDPNRMWSVTGVSDPPWPFQRLRSLDGGTNWQGLNSGIDPNNVFGGTIRTDNAFPVRLYTSTDVFVYESTDVGATWTKVNSTPFPAPIKNLTSSTRVSPSSVLYVTLQSSTPGQRLYVRDGGQWVERSAGLAAGSVWKVVPHPWAAYADVAWAIVGAGTWRIYRTDDRGLSWTDITSDFPIGIPISDIVPNPRKTGELFVGTFLGCYRTPNGGGYWERWNNGMPPATMVTEMTYIDLVAGGGDFYVVAATYGRSVWKRAISGTDPCSGAQVFYRDADGDGFGTPTITTCAARHLQATSASTPIATTETRMCIPERRKFPATGSTTTAML